MEQHGQFGRSHHRRWRGVALSGHLQRGCRFALPARAARQQPARLPSGAGRRSSMPAASRPRSRLPSTLARCARSARGRSGGGGRQWPCSFRQPYWETDNIVEPTLARRLSIGKREQGRNNGVNGLTCVSECGARSSWRSQSPLLKTRSSVVPGGIGTMKLPASLNPLPAKKLTATSRGITAG